METEKRITRAHMRTIYNLLTEKNIYHLESFLCMKFSNNRTSDDFELTLPEARELIKYIRTVSKDELNDEYMISVKQKKLIHFLLAKNGITNQKNELCLNFSYHRTEHTTDLTKVEAEELIQYLLDNDECELMIKRIWHLGYVSNIIYGDTKEDLAINAAKLDMFLRQRGSVKLPLRQQDLEELGKTLRQFEAIASKVNEKQALKSYILHFENEIQKCIKSENYERATKHQQAIEKAKYNPKLAVAFFKKQREKEKQE